MKPWKDKLPNVEDIPKVPNWHDDTLPNNWYDAPITRQEDKNTKTRDGIDLPIYPDALPDFTKPKISENLDGVFVLDKSNKIWNFSDEEIKNAVKDKIMQNYDINREKLNIVVDRENNQVSYKYLVYSKSYVETIPLYTLSEGDIFVIPDTEVPKNIKNKVIPFKTEFKVINKDKVLLIDSNKDFTIVKDTKLGEGEARIDFDIGIILSDILVVVKEKEEGLKDKATIEKILDYIFYKAFGVYTIHKVKDDKYVIVPSSEFMKSVYEKGVSSEELDSITDKKGVGYTAKYIWFPSKDMKSVIIQKI